MTKYFMFTLNNPSDEDDFNIVELKTTFTAWQLEQGKEGTEHYQGYLCFPNQVRFNKLHEWLPGAHIEGRKGTHEQALAYVTKEDTRVGGPWILGDDKDIPRKKGQRTDLLVIQKKIQAGEKFNKIKEEHFSSFIRYEKAFKKYENELIQEKWYFAKKLEYSTMTLRPWQKEVVKKLEMQNSTQILWVWEPTGKVGKSWLAMWLHVMKGAALFQLAPKADIAYAYKKEPVVVYDLTRSDEEFTNYQVIEKFKDGALFSTKYESILKVFTPPALVIFANFRPQKEKLSTHRWDILNL